MQLHPFLFEKGCSTVMDRGVLQYLSNFIMWRSVSNKTNRFQKTMFRQHQDRAHLNVPLSGIAIALLPR